MSSKQTPVSKERNEVPRNKATPTSSDKTDTVKKSKRGRPQKPISSRDNSRTNSPRVSPTRDRLDDDDAWVCIKCKVEFTNPDDMLLECQRCKDHFCIDCLNKSAEEYRLLSKTDLMWFCPPCREKVEKNIITDRKIEETCKEMMNSFEKRVSSIESALEEKCDRSEVLAYVKLEVTKSMMAVETCHKEDVSEIVHDELKKLKIGESADSSGKNSSSEVDEVVSELNERKARENNLIIYDFPEHLSDNREERQKFDIRNAKEIIQICDESVDEAEIVRTIRLGKFDRKKPKRPLLVTLAQGEKKGSIFKGAHKLNDHENFKDVRMANDLTKAERKREQELFDKAKQMAETGSGDYKYNVRGPPLARRIVRVRTSEEA